MLRGRFHRFLGMAGRGGWNQGLGAAVRSGQLLVAGQRSDGPAKRGKRMRAVEEAVGEELPDGLAEQQPHLLGRPAGEPGRAQQRPGRRQTVTGIVVNKRPNVPRRVTRRLRAILHHAQKEGLAAQNRARKWCGPSWSCSARSKARLRTRSA